MPSLNSSHASGKDYWRSLEEVADTPEFRRFMHHEFPAGAADLIESGDRRQFLKIMAASMALAGLGTGGCRRWPQETIAPYAKRPEGRIPGQALSYATCLELGGVATGLLATSSDGRPTKIEGNPDHPANRGRTDVFAQASVLDLYDPDRSRSARHDDEPKTWTEFTAAMQETLGSAEAARGAGLAILAEASFSPSVDSMKRRVMERFPRATWHEYEPVHNDEVLRGAELAFGAPFVPQHDLAEAKIIVSLDEDFMFGPGAVRHIGDFATGRRVSSPGDPMSRMYCFESALTITGANADHRAAVRSADVAVIAAWLAARIVGDESLQRFEQDDAGRAVLDEGTLKVLEHALEDLRAHEGESVIMAGPRQPAEVHMLVHVMNSVLGNAGRTVHYTSRQGIPRHVESLKELCEAIDAGAVQTLVILGGNPVYNAPADLDFASRLAKVTTSIHLGDAVDETAAACTWHVNAANYLESWGDARSADGTFSLCQPLIQPLFDGRSRLELLALLAGDELTAGYDIVRRTFQEMTGASDIEPLWRRTLHDGLLVGSASTRETLRPRREAVADAAAALYGRWSALPSDGLEVVFVPDYSLYDGRFANNGWLQELPDPITKVTWDNAVVVGVATAEELGLETGDVIRVSVGGRTTTDAAVFVLPGQAERSLTLSLGYGRSRPGRVGVDAGFDFYPLRTSDAMGFALGASVQTIGGRYQLVTTQDHHAIDVSGVGGRGQQDRLPTLVRMATMQEYREHPDFAQHRTHVVHRLSVFEEDFPFHTDGGGDADYAWGMSIDLTTCVGCNACVVACQAENNIPIVGKDQVSRGREMHWLRVDRYFKFGHGEDGRPDPHRLERVAHQPVPCMHCENAPCETVCPVAATVHDEDGLNVMVYNRCIGTRYCSNNCPYKVRRFNYFDYHRRDPAREQPGALLAVEPNYFQKPQAAAEPLQQMQFNPEVTVRVRGVMEKCTFCVQRTTAAKIKAKNQWVDLPEGSPEREDRRVPIEDGAVLTACQQACPADAIVFGDLKDRDSRVSRLRRHDRSYGMLEEINTKPRATYLAGLTNPAYVTDVPNQDAHH
ncbi:MAG: TAT-variant-translocated molybdopterin oxidoreductase [Planctomycetota bacterium]|jgi:molybdopterin-containing oxidoreductase family iron-sulfur binding subunit